MTSPPGGTNLPISMSVSQGLSMCSSVPHERRGERLQEEIRRRYEPKSDSDTRRLQAGKTLKTMEDVVQQLDLDPAKKTAVVFSHITWDSSFFHGEDLFDGYEEWLVEAARIACSNPAVNWVIKLHPANIQKLRGANVRGEASEVVSIRKAIGQLPGHVKVLPSETDINTFSLFELADYCLTVRGTIGIEMACFGIPVLTAGTGRYSGRGFTVDSASREEYLERLRRIQEIPPMLREEIELAKKHAYWVFNLRPVNLDVMHKVWRQDLAENKGHPLASNERLLVSSMDDLASDRSLNGFADWVLSSREADYCLDP